MKKRKGGWFMKKLAKVSVWIMAASFLLCGVLPLQAADKAVVLRAATNNPKGSGHYKGLLIFKDLVEKRTNGAVTVELYADAVLGDEEQMAEGMKMGTVDVMMAASAKYANFVPEHDLYSPPYTFKSWDHMKAVVASDINTKIEKATKDRRGDIFLGVFTDGLRNIFTRQPVKSLADLKGLKLRTMTGPNETNSFKALATNPTPLAYTELYSALQSGVVDGAENTMTSVLGMKFHESCKYILRTGHNYLTLPFFISAKAVEKIPANLRETVIKAGRDTCKEQVDWAIKNDMDNEKVLKTQYGVTVFEFSKADLEKAIELCRVVQDENAKRIKMEPELAKIREMGKKF
jgi:tripartite ATP-independent transporter DctP family solute receptor